MSERWAVVLGVSSGNGLEIARAVARDPGLSIFGAHRGNFPEQADELVTEVEGRGRRGVLHVGDVGTWAGVQAGVDALADVVAPRSVALFVHSIANASLGRFVVGGDGPFRPFIERNFHKTLDSMANSFCWWAQALYERDLLAPGSRLLGLTNPIADSMINNFGLITAAKAALEVYVRHLAWEMGSQGHRINLLNFGTVDTPAVKRAFTPERWERFRRVVERAIPAGRMLTTVEVGAFVSKLMAEEAGWINGAVIDFTGGQSQSLLDALLYDDWRTEDDEAAVRRSQATPTPHETTATAHAVPNAPKEDS